MAYYSPQTPGSAYTFKQSMPKPVQVIDRYNQEQAATKAAQAAAAADQAKENRKNMLETLKYNPESVIKEYDAAIKRNVNEDFIPHVASVYKGGRVPSTEDLAGIQKKQNEIELLTEKQKAVKENLDGVLTQIKGDKEINHDVVYQKVEDFIYETDAKGNKKLKDLSTIDPEEIKGILDSTDAYNVDAVVSNFSDNIAENIDSFIKEGGGTLRPWRESKEVKSKFLVLDKFGDPAVDDNGNYVLNLTPDTLKMALSNPRMARAIESKAAKLSEERGQEVTKMQALKELMAPKAYAQENTKRTNASVKDDDAARNANFIFGSREKHTNAEARYDAIGKVLMNKDEKELQRLSGKNIESAKFTNTHPLTGKDFDSPHLVIYKKNNETSTTETETESGDSITTKKNKQTGSTPQVFDLSNPFEREKAFYILNASMTDSNGAKVTDDELKAFEDHLKSKSPDQLYHNKYKKKPATETASTTKKAPSFQPGK